MSKVRGKSGSHDRERSAFPADMINAVMALLIEDPLAQEILESSGYREWVIPIIYFLGHVDDEDGRAILAESFIRGKK